MYNVYLEPLRREIALKHGEHAADLVKSAPRVDAVTKNLAAVTDALHR